MLAQLLEQLVDALGNAHAGLDGPGAPAHAVDLRAQCFGLLVAVVVVHHHVAAGRGELAGDGAADAARGAGHQGGFLREGFGHVKLLGQEGSIRASCAVCAAPLRAGSHHPVALRAPPLLGQEGSDFSRLSRGGVHRCAGAVWCWRLLRPCNRHSHHPVAVRAPPLLGQEGSLSARRAACATASFDTALGTLAPGVDRPGSPFNPRPRARCRRPAGAWRPGRRGRSHCRAPCWRSRTGARGTAARAARSARPRRCGA